MARRVAVGRSGPQNDLRKLLSETLDWSHWKWLDASRLAAPDRRTTYASFYRKPWIGRIGNGSTRRGWPLRTAERLTQASIGNLGLAKVSKPKLEPQHNRDASSHSKRG
ncbi:unnamed protein product [Caenorhabditis auriculariae]|uniref:Uncharacterized protein n=1 Tax=Caenorhabditis auriculariae TaxID=2777116 RepID=A0A8S1GQQ7_9PELO|nr:unnamed protein product [Caenorhabditis auriculariae]